MTLDSRIRCARALAGEALEGDRDELSVHAEQLLAAGDVRGELLQLNLDGVSASQHPHTLALDFERAFGERWREFSVFGSGAWWTVRPSWRAAHVIALELRTPVRASGRVDLRPLLRDPALELLSTLRVSLAAWQREAWLDALATHPLPLIRLELTDDMQGPASGPSFDPPAAARLCAALPELRELSARGPHTLACLSHPRIHTLELDSTSLPELELPALRQLGVRGYLTQDQCEGLFAQTALLAQLQQLTLGTVNIDVLQRLLPHLPPIPRVNVNAFAPPPLDSNYQRIRWYREELPPRIEQLRAALPQLEVGGGTAEPDLPRGPRRRRILLWPHTVEGRHSVWLRADEFQHAVERSELSSQQLGTASELLRHLHAASPDKRDLDASPLFELFAALRGHSPAFAKHFACFELHRDCCPAIELCARV